MSPEDNGAPSRRERAIAALEDMHPAVMYYTGWTEFCESNPTIRSVNALCLLLCEMTEDGMMLELEAEG